MRLDVSALVTAAILVAVGPIPQAAFAHHSGAMYDTTQVVTYSGTLNKVEWSNPHVWITVVVPGDSGPPVEWQFEGNPPEWLVKQGLRKANLTEAISQKVTVDTHPFRDGRPAGQLLSITFADGHSIKLK